MKTAEIMARAIQIGKTCFAKDSKSGLVVFTPEYGQDKMWLCDQLINSLSREGRLIEQRDEAIRLLEMREKENEALVKTFDVFFNQAKEHKEELFNINAVLDNVNVSLTNKLEIATEALESVKDYFCACSIDDEIIPQVVAHEALAEIKDVK